MQLKDITKADILSVTRNKKVLLRYRALYAFLWLTGARISEALEVRPRDIEVIEKYGIKLIRIRLFTLKQRGIKKLRPRYWFIDPQTDGDVWEPVQEYLMGVIDPSAKVWYISRRSGYKHARRLFDERTHAFRHSWTMEQARRNVSAFVVQDGGGWADASILSKYRAEFTQDDIIRFFARKHNENNKEVSSI